MERERGYIYIIYTILASHDRVMLGKTNTLERDEGDEEEEEVGAQVERRARKV